MNRHSLYDIAVIGGGLAGLCFAIQAAQQQYKVVLIEKEQYPFHKVCGEYISLESWGFLETIGVPLKDWHLPLIKKLQASDVKGNQYSFDLPLGGFGVSRYKLDHFLYQLAIKNGVEVQSQTKVLDVHFTGNSFVVKTTLADINAKVVAGSYGKRSNLDVKWNRNFIAEKQSGLHNYIAIKYHARFNVPNTTIALHNFKNGYCGISDIEDGQSCICYITTAKQLRDNDNAIDKMERTILFKNPLIKAAFSKAKFIYNKPLAISQISFSKKTQVQNNVLMLGDAAGMITPLCGNGMSMAMHSSKLAFEAVHRYLQNEITRKEMEQNYMLRWDQTFAKRLWMGRNVQRLFGADLSTSVFLKTMSCVPALARQVIHATHGEPF